MKLVTKKNNDETGNIFWITMTDLMTALVLVFMILFFYTYLTSYYDKIQSQIEQKNTSQAIEETLKKQNIDVDVDKTTGVVKISDLELFFP